MANFVRTLVYLNYAGEWLDLWKEYILAQAFDIVW